MDELFRQQLTSAPVYKSVVVVGRPGTYAWSRRLRRGGELCRLALGGGKTTSPTGT